MGKSYKKHPYSGNASGSEKQDKRLANRRLRKVVNQKLKNFTEETMLPDIREVSDVWSMNKDGKSYRNKQDLIDRFGEEDSARFWREIVGK